MKGGFGEPGFYQRGPGKLRLAANGRGKYKFINILIDTKPAPRADLMVQMFLICADLPFPGQRPEVGRLRTRYTSVMSMYKLLATLSDAGVDYVLIGGLAVTLHGYQRVTLDVDVVLSMNDANLAKFIDSAKAAGLKPVLPIEIEALRDSALIERWHREKGMRAFALRIPDAMAAVIDVLVRPVVSFDELKRNAVVKHVGPLSIPVASIDDLIRLKTGTGRSKDVLDIEELEKIKRQLVEE